MPNTKYIEILELNVKEAGKQMPPDTLAALKKGIEALKYVEKIRRYPHLIDELPIPSDNDNGSRNK